MAGQQPQTLRNDELPEYSFTGPFGGIQSEVQLDQIGRSGFVDIQNLILRKSMARLVPAFTSLTSPSGEIIIGIADFFNVSGVRRFVVWTPTKMYYFNAGVWVQVTGVLTGSTTQYMQWDVVGYKLYFSQQKDTIWVWDGITAGFATASVSANNVPSKYLCEVGFHLLAANTIETGVTAPNRIRWSGIGDGTDWTSFSSGQTDLFNGLGPINGLARIYQNGYAFQQWGITQIVPTGIGLAPFQFISMGSRAKGSILPYGVASFGEMVACYVGKNDIYLFDGTESQPIGSRPIDGNRRLGARSRIFSDLFVALQTNIFGFILSSANGNDYESYWLFIPSLNKAWVFHFDEGSWTQINFATNRLIGPVGVAPLANAPRWLDLVGTWIAQSATWASLANANQLDTMAISDSLTNSVSFFDFSTPSSSPTTRSINPSDGWYLRSGQLNFDDARHSHTTKKIRLRLVDYAPITINLRFKNENSQQQTLTLTYGTGSGATLTRVLSVSLPGEYMTYEISGPQGINFGMTEICPVYDVSGEIQMGVR